MTLKFMKIEVQSRQTHWPSILVLICLVLGAGFFLLGSIGFLLNSIFLIFNVNGDPIGSLISALAAAFEGVLLVISSWFVFQKLSGDGKSELDMTLSFPRGYIFSAILVVIAAFFFGSAISIHNSLPSGLLVQPGFTLLVITIPIILLAYSAIRKLYMGPRWQTWAIFGLGMTLTPLIVIGIELFFAFVFLTILTLVIVTQPELFYEFSQVVQNFDPQIGQEKFLELFGSVLVRPGVIAGILFYLAVIVPFTEELFKPLGVWLFSSKIQQPSQGFALGIVCGSAFAIVEGLGISGQGGTQWPVIVGLRAGTSLLHIATSGLMGFAIISAIKEKRISLLVISYLTTVSIHGLWNAAAAGMGIAVVTEFSGIDHFLAKILPASIGAIAVLLTGLLIMLQSANRRFTQ
jgi:hypothetical protein